MSVDQFQTTKKCKSRTERLSVNLLPRSMGASFSDCPFRIHSCVDDVAGGTSSYDRKTARLASSGTMAIPPPLAAGPAFRRNYQM